MDNDLLYTLLTIEIKIISCFIKMCGQYNKKDDKMKNIFLREKKCLKI